MLGHIAFDSPDMTNEKVLLQVAKGDLARAKRNCFVRVTNAVGRGEQHLARVIGGPFFPPNRGAAGSAIDHAHMTLEIIGEVREGRLRAPNTRPGPGSEVVELGADEVEELLSVRGDIPLGSLEGYPEVRVNLDSSSKAILPRNVGIFGTVGSGKSNTCQTLIEGAAAAGFAVIVIDVEGEYIEMDQPSVETELRSALAEFELEPTGLPLFKACYPVSAECDRDDATEFTLRTCDFHPGVLAEIMEADLDERSALLDVVDYYLQRDESGRDSDPDRLLLDENAPLPYHLGDLLDRCGRRAAQPDASTGYDGASLKLSRLLHSGAFDFADRPAIAPAALLKPGLVTVVDVSTTSDQVKNLVTADLLRKVFAYKIRHEEAPPTLLVIEEAHSFISRERAGQMGETLNMVRDIARRGRKRWLGLSFVTQQPGHLPDEFFELCNTRIVHNVKSLHNLTALTRTAGEVTQEMWDRCPTLAPGQALLSCPNFRSPLLTNVRPAMTKRRFVM